MLLPVEIVATCDRSTVPPRVAETKTLRQVVTWDRSSRLPVPSAWKLDSSMVVSGNANSPATPVGLSVETVTLPCWKVASPATGREALAVRWRSTFVRLVRAGATMAAPPRLATSWLRRSVGRLVASPVKLVKSVKWI